jgi:drug/metabolite transporter (DMT)-like permease
MSSLRSRIASLTDVRLLPPLAWLALAILAVSTSAILIRWSDAPPQVAALYRILFTLLLLAPATLYRHPRTFERFDRRDVAVAVLSGVALAAHFASWFESLSWTSVAASVTLVQAQPVFVAVGAWALLDERVTRPMTQGIVLAVGGGLLLSVGEASGATAAPWPLWGNALALLGALMAATYILVGRSLRQRLPLLPYVAVVYATCVVGLLAFVLAAGFPLAGYPPREWLLFLAMAVGPGILGHTVINWLLEEVESTVVGVALVGEPLGSTVLAALLLGEVPGWLTAVGGVVVLAGIVRTARNRAAA